MNIITTLKRATLLSAVVLCGFAVNAQTFDHEGITYKVSGTTVIIQKASATIGSYSGDLVIPESVDYNGRQLPLRTLRLQGGLRGDSIRGRFRT